MTSLAPVVSMLAAGALAVATAQMPFEVHITSPAGDALLVGTTAIDTEVSAIRADVQSVSFYVDGRLTCTRTAPPWRCEFEAGASPTRRHLRVVAKHTDGRRAVANRHTQSVGFTESVRVSAVQVPVVVRDSRGRLLRDITADQFRIEEDGVLQQIESVAHEDVPVDVILALDISDSMKDVLADVLDAGTRFLDKLRPRDSATVLAFNDNTFLVVDRTTNPLERQLSRMDLTAWGGTALYDATLEALTLAARTSGRKGVVIFTDGEDRMSRTNSSTAARRIQASDVLVYTIAFGAGASDPDTRRHLQLYATASGGRVFFAKGAEDLRSAFDEIVAELTTQYVLSYLPRANRPGWRRLAVSVNARGARVYARDGYLAGAQ